MAIFYWRSGRKRRQFFSIDFRYVYSFWDRWTHWFPGSSILQNRKSSITGHDASKFMGTNLSCHELFYDYSSEFKTIWMVVGDYTLVWKQYKSCKILARFLARFYKIMHFSCRILARNLQDMPIFCKNLARLALLLSNLSDSSEIFIPLHLG